MLGLAVWVFPLMVCFVGTDHEHWGHDHGHWRAGTAPGAHLPQRQLGGPLRERSCDGLRLLLHDVRGKLTSNSPAACDLLLSRTDLLSLSLSLSL